VATRRHDGGDSSAADGDDEAATHTPHGTQGRQPAAHTAIVSRETCENRYPGDYTNL
jgi:hypothetical protein